MAVALKWSWALCTTFSLAPAVYVLFTTYQEVWAGTEPDAGYSYVIVFAMAAYAVVVIIQPVLFAFARRSSGGWGRLAVGYAAFPLALAFSYIAYGPVREARRVAGASGSAVVACLEPKVGSLAIAGRCNPPLQADTGRQRSRLSVPPASPQLRPNSVPSAQCG